MSATPAADAITIGAALAFDIWAVGPGRFRDRVTTVTAVAGLAPAAATVGWQSWAAGWAAGQNTLPMLTAGESAGIAVACQIIGCVFTLPAAIFLVGFLLPSGLSRWIGRFARATLAGSDDVRISWRIWLLVLALVFARPLAWGPIRVLADLLVGGLTWLVNEHFWGWGAPAAGGPIAAGVLLTGVGLLLAVFAGWRPDLIVEPSPGYFRHWLAATFSQVTAVGVGGGDGDGEATDDRPADDGNGTEVVPGVIVGKGTNGHTYERARFTRGWRFAPWYERMFGVPPQAVADIAPEIPAAPEPWWDWLCECVRQDRRAVDIIRKGRQTWKGSTRTWERRIQKAREHVRLEQAA